MSVQRYLVGFCFECEGGTLNEHGEFVRYEDYEKLEKRLKLAEAVVEVARVREFDNHRQLDDWAIKLDEAVDAYDAYIAGENV